MLFIKSLSAFLLSVVSLTAAGQQIPYGNNPRAGSYHAIRGIRIYCETYGNGKPLLLLHGNGGNISAFQNSIAYFAAKYKVIAVDSRAHGKTTDPKDSLSFEMMADDDAALLDALHIDSACVLGWSDGGIVALLMAMRHPGKVIALASTGANLTPDSLGIIPSEWKNEAKTFHEHKANPAATAKEKNDWKIFLLDWLQPNIPFGDLRRITCPSLIICGDHDVIPIVHTVKIFQHISHGALWVVPNSGHATLVEHRDDFNRLVDGFFQHPAWQN